MFQVKQTCTVIEFQPNAEASFFFLKKKMRSKLAASFDGGNELSYIKEETQEKKETEEKGKRK